MDAQGSQAGAKEDTVFLALSSALTTDLSQYDTDLTAISTGAYETNSARTDLDEEWEVYARCSLTAADKDKVLVAVHSADLSTITLSLRITSGLRFAAKMGASDVWTGPSTPTGDCSFAWHMRVNPDTTVASDARISTFIVYDHTAGAYLAIETITHAAPTAAATHTLSVGGLYNAAGPSLGNAPTNVPSKVRISRSCHNAVEFGEDWVTAAGESMDDVITEPIGAGLDVAGVAQWAGQANVGFAAAHANALRGRMLSPLLNESYPEARTLTTTPDPTQWVLNAPGSSVYKMDCTKLRWVSCEGWQYARVRVHVLSWVDSGSAVPIGIRAVATNRPHLGLGLKIEGQPLPALQVEFVEATLTEDHTSTGVGEWLDLGALRLPGMVQTFTGWAGSVTLGLAYAFDPASSSTNDANARLMIKAWEVLPIVGEP